MRYFASVPNDPDTHDDFKPTSKVQSSGISLNDVVEQVTVGNAFVIEFRYRS